MGVLGVAPALSGPAFTQEQRQTLEAYANLIASGHRARPAWPNRPARPKCCEITDKLQAALLNSISHDLRTPLVSITGGWVPCMQPGGMTRPCWTRPARPGPDRDCPARKPTGSTAW